MTRRKMSRRQRRGAFLVLAALMMVIMMAFLAFCVDLGYLINAKFRISGSELIVSAEKFSAVLKRLG